jgi:hypothetical protein
VPLCHSRITIHQSVPDKISEEDEDYDSNSQDEEEDSNESKNEDTDIEEDQVCDLEKDTAVNMPPKKKSFSPKPSASKKKVADAALDDDISMHMTRMSVATVPTPPSVCLDFRLPFSMYKSTEEATVRIYIELVGCQLPDDFLKHAKVLPGGMKFSVLIGAPHMMFEEGFIRVRMGTDWVASSATAVAFNEQVVQPARKMFPGNSDSIDRNPILINLDEQCIEGNVVILNGDRRVRWTLRVERQRQYLRGWTFHLEAVRRNVVRVPRLERAVFGYGDIDVDSSTSDDVGDLNV